MLTFVIVKNFWSCPNLNLVIFIWSCDLASKIFRYFQRNIWVWDFLLVGPSPGYYLWTEFSKNKETGPLDQNRTTEKKMDEQIFLTRWPNHKTEFYRWTEYKHIKLIRIVNCDVNNIILVFWSDNFGSSWYGRPNPEDRII